MGKGFLFPICFKVLTAGSAISASRPLFCNVQFMGIPSETSKKPVLGIIQQLSAIQVSVMPRMVLHCWKSKHCLYWGLTSALFWCCGWVPLGSVLHLWEWSNSSCGVGPSLGANRFFLLEKDPFLWTACHSFPLWILDAFAWVRNLPPLGPRGSDGPLWHPNK